MNNNHRVLLKLAYPVLFVGLTLFTQAHAVEQPVTDKMKLNSMPPAPVGPYRSTHGSRQFTPESILDNRQWTPPSPPHWVQQSQQAPLQQGGDEKQHRQQVIQVPESVSPQSGLKHWPPIQYRQVPVQQLPPPVWVQQQHRQAPVQQPAPPVWVQQQRRQVPVQRPVSPPWWVQQQRGQMPLQPPAYVRPPVQGYPPYPVYRR